MYAVGDEKMKVSLLTAWNYVLIYTFYLLSSVFHTAGVGDAAETRFNCLTHHNFPKGNNLLVFYSISNILI